MATIIDIRRRAEARPEDSRPTGDARGEVIIFPGVRYERMPDGAAPRQGPPPPRKPAVTA